MGLLNKKRKTLEWVFAIYFGIYRNEVTFNKSSFPSFSGYPFVHSINLYVVRSLAGGVAPAHGFWVQPLATVAGDLNSQYS
jgi:hypothetical protein